MVFELLQLFIGFIGVLLWLIWGVLCVLILMLAINREWSLALLTAAVALLVIMG